MCSPYTTCLSASFLPNSVHGRMYDITSLLQSVLVDNGKNHTTGAVLLTFVSDKNIIYTSNRIRSRDIRFLKSITLTNQIDYLRSSKGLYCSHFMILFKLRYFKSVAIET